MNISITREWNESLGLEAPLWPNLGKHLASIVREAMQNQGRCALDMREVLIGKGHYPFEKEFMKEYLSGEVSMGCFFPALREELQILATRIFPNTSDPLASSHLIGLESYLTDISNFDALTPLMIHSSQDGLQKHIATYLSSKRDAIIKQPIGRVEISRKVREQLPPINEHSTDEMTTSYFDALRPEVERRSAPLREEGFELDDLRMSVEAPSLSNTGGLSVRFYYPSGDFFDRYVEENPLLGLERGDWVNAYQKGIVSPNLVKSPFFTTHGINLDELIPLREFKESERFEFHQRWVMDTGGAYHASPGDESASKEMERGKQLIDPSGRSVWEEIAYRTNSNLVSVYNLFENLPSLTGYEK